MFNGFRRFVCGWRELVISKNSQRHAFSVLYSHGVKFEREKRRLDGDVRVIIRERSWREVAGIFAEDEIEYRISDVHGIPYFLSFIKKRPMLAIGFALFIVWMSYSSHLIWEVRIIGNDKTPAEKIIAKLDELGCGVGDYYPDIDFNVLHSVYAAEQHDIAWLSVFMNGTVAEVQVRELYAGEKLTHEKGLYANITAECDGIVEEVNVFEGQACVKSGDIVRKGQLLISGVVQGKPDYYGDESLESRYEYAAGEVICSVPVPISERISLTREEKVYTGREKTQKTVKFFKNSLNLFVNSGIVYDVYDKIDTLEQLCPFGLCEVPVWIETSVYREYEIRTVTVTPEEAAEEAVMGLSEKIRELTEDGELTKKEIRTKVDGGEYMLDGVVHVSRDIGVTQEFSVVDPQTGQIQDAGEDNNG